jgi:hydroxymethylbilane synthase
MAVERGAREAIHDRPAALAVRAERGFLGRLQGGCQVPIAAYAQLEGPALRPRLRLHGRVLSLEGDRKLEGEADALVTSEADAEEVGARLGERLLEQGAGEILTAVRASGVPVVTEP